MQQNSREKDSIQNTITNWPSNYSENQQVNNIWKALPGFITWTIWKERNRRIFQNEYRNTEHSRITLTQNICQLILIKCKADPTIQASVEHQRILNAFNLYNEQCQDSHTVQENISTAPKGWTQPPEGFMKLNFDGASRGNPGPTGIGGIIRNQAGKIIHIYSKALGEGTNNEIEFAAMEKGIKILQRKQAGNAVIEGDSEIAIAVARKIYEGTPASKVTKHWRLAMVTESIGKLLGGMKGLIFQAIRRNANSIADHLANYGIDHPNDMLDNYWHQVELHQLKGKCLQLSRADLLAAEKAGR